MFTKILIANRGEIAVRIIRACRELGITAVAVYSETDRGALHVREAGEACLLAAGAGVPIPYLSADAIIAAALECGAQAIHPGYGFLSERAHFARACREAGIVFIGPPPEAIELIGSKIAAKQLAAQAGVPAAPDYLGADQNQATLVREAARIGFPLLIKASAGGGGKGMRTVREPDELVLAIEGAQREAQAAFGDRTIFLEKLIEQPRHIEFQILADQHGNCVHLFERECSIQRRHQKIIEESPSPALTPELRAEMGNAAVRLVQAAGYHNAGTIEFLLDSAGHYYFLEMNTRLQVEHPVTELVTGHDLVQLQIAIAAGERLPFTQDQLTQHGHAIEARIYAEEPDTFLPSIGRVALFAPPEGPGIRNDSGIESGDEVTVFFDPMLAKLIVYAPERQAAIARLKRALDEYIVLGVTTNLPLLRAIAAHPQFANGITYTDFLAASGLAGMAFGTPTPAPVLLAAAALWEQQSDSSTQADPWQSGAWEPLGGRRYSYRIGADQHVVSVLQRPDTILAATGSTTLAIEQIAIQSHTLILRLNTPQLGISKVERFAIARDGAALLIAWRGFTYRLERVSGLNIDDMEGRHRTGSNQASLEAPMPGTVIKVLVEEGQEVAAHQPLVVLEAMKMEHIVAAPYDGIVRRLLFAPGALVTRGTALVELEQKSDLQ